MKISDLRNKFNIDVKKLIAIETVRSSDYHRTCECILFKFKDDDNTYSIPQRGTDNVLDKPRNFRAAYARINGMKFADIEKMRAEHIANKSQREREALIDHMHRLAAEAGVTIKFC